MDWVSDFNSDTSHPGVKLISKKLMPLTPSSCDLWSHFFHSAEVMDHWCSVLHSILQTYGLITDLSSWRFSFPLCSLTCLAFSKGCNLLGINLYAALSHTLAPELMDGDVHREYLIISTVGGVVCYVRKNGIIACPVQSFICKFKNNYACSF